MRWLWAHRFSMASFALVLCEIFIAFGLVSRWHLGAALRPGTLMLRSLALLWFLVGMAAVCSATAAMAKERNKVSAMVAVTVSGLTFFVCMFRFMV